MSNSINVFNLARAVAYNTKTRATVPPYILSLYPRLAAPKDSEEFAWVILGLQSDLGFEEHDRDGKYGHGTRSALLRTCDDNQYIVNNGERIPIKASHYKVIAFDSSDPARMDLHPRGHWSSRRSEPAALMLHWGGIDAQHCFNVFNGDRKVSSHFLIGLVDSAVVIYQTLDIAKKAWHCGKHNDWTVGIDICQQPTPRWFSLYKKKKYDVQHMENPTNRGPQKLITLDPRLVKATREFVEDLLCALNIQHIAPSSFSPADPRQYTVLSHAHVSKTKFDIAPWWSMIFDEEEA